MKRTSVRKVSKRRGKQRGEYLKVRERWLDEHRLCQATLLELRLKEEDVMTYGEPLTSGVVFRVGDAGKFIPFASEIHHRLRKFNTRLTDTRWFLSVCREMHDKIESQPSWARSVGLLLDQSCNNDGMTPSGLQALTTTELMARI